MNDHDGIKLATRLFFNGAKLVDGWMKPKDMEELIQNYYEQGLTVREALDKAMKLVSRIRKIRPEEENQRPARKYPYYLSNGLKIVAEGTKYDAKYSDSWRNWVLIDPETIPENWDNDDLLFNLDMVREYHGPGQFFSHAGWLREKTYSGWLFEQYCGYDV
jgi:hypothetical protein